MPRRLGKGDPAQEKKQPLKSVWQANSPRSSRVGEAEGISMRKLLNSWSTNSIPHFSLLTAGGKVSRKNEPEELTMLIQDTKEKAYQRAFFLSRERRTVVRGATSGDFVIEWLDLELPVVPGRRGSPRLDLVGKNLSKHFAIAELKAEGGTSPFNAVQEVISYGVHARDNARQLESHPRFISDSGTCTLPEFWKQYSGRDLIVGATESYWSEMAWKPHINKVLDAGRKWLMESGLKDHRILFVQFPSEDFRRQRARAGGGRYVPQLEINRAAEWIVFGEI